MNFIKVTAFFSLTILMNINAQWSTNYKENLQITDWSRLPLSATSDGNGGVFIALNKDSDFPKANLYLFKINKYGYSNWVEPIHIGIKDLQDKVELIEDGFGGVIACIRDLELINWDGFYMTWDYKIRVQRIDSLGNKLWGEGVLVSTDTTDQYQFDICTDGNGGCYVSWLSEKTMDYINSDGYRAIQHISAKGERMWSDTGKILYKGPVANFSKQHYQIDKDNNGGIYVINTTNINDNIFILISSDGIILNESTSRIGSWITNFKVINDGSLIVFSNTWDSLYSSVTIKMDKLDLSGQYFYQAPILFAESVGGKSEIIDLFFNEDSSTSIYWSDKNMDGSINGNYYQKVSRYGNLQIENKGNSPFSATAAGSAMFKSNEEYLCISGDFVQKLTKDGEKLWGENGIQFSNRIADYDDFISDTKGGFIKVWIEGLDGLWAQQVSSNGNLGKIITGMEFNNILSLKNYKLYQNYPNPFNPSTIVKYEISEHSKVKIEIFNMLGQSVGVLVNSEKQAGFYEATWNAENLPSGIYLISIRAEGFSSKKNFTQIKKALLLK